MKLVNPGAARFARLKTFPLIIRRILFSTDLTWASSRALDAALHLAGQNHADLVLVHVLPPPTPIFEIEPAMRPAAESALAALLEKVIARGVRGKKALIKGSGSVGRNIVRCAKFFNADLIVMGTHGRTGVASWLAGSVAAKVIATAHCPVLVVRGQR